MHSIISLLRDNRALAIDDLVASIIEGVPHYSIAGSTELRQSVEVLFEDFLRLLETGEATALTTRLAQIAEKRIDQGFSPADFLRALLLIYPVVRTTVRRAGPRNDPTLAKMFEQVELAVIRIASIASNIFASGMIRAVDEKNQQLQRDLQQMEQKDLGLVEDARKAHRAQRQAEELNSRVIASLSSGVLVVETPSLQLRMWSRRLEEITGIPASEVVGRTAAELGSKLKGISTEEVVSTVKATGRMPLTKFPVEFPNGKRKHIFLRGERLRDAQGSQEGVVLIVDDITERELLIDSFSRFVSKEVVQRVLSRSEPSRLEGERKLCTVLFADVRGFTGIAERITPESLHELLNVYFRVMIEKVTTHGGIIDKFIGDKVMAVFASSGQEAESALSAASASAEMIEEIAQLNAQREAANQELLEVGVGLNTGAVMMGNVGSEERMSFTVIGDVVNVADRLQSLAGAGEIYVGARTRELISERFELEEIGERTLKGRSTPEHMFRLLRAK